MYAERLQEKKDFALLYPKEGYRLWIFYFKSFFQNTKEKKSESQECFLPGVFSQGLLLLP